MNKRIFAGILLAITLAACGHGAAVCGVVDVTAEAAQQACTVLRYLGPDGKVYEVRMTNKELAEYGRKTAAQRAAASAPAPQAPPPASSAGGQ
jgi:hypothetical protein